MGINIVCFSKFSQRGPDQTDEGIEINSGVQVHSAPLKFSMDGCVKFAYPHGHDELLMIGLDNMTKKQTLLRTVPDVSQDGTFREFLPHQVYQDGQGFPVTKADDYEMVMVHHHPLQKQERAPWNGKLFAVHDPWRLSDDIQYITRQVAATHPFTRRTVCGGYRGASFTSSRPRSPS